MQYHDINKDLSEMTVYLPIKNFNMSKGTLLQLIKKVIESPTTREILVMYYTPVEEEWFHTFVSDIYPYKQYSLENIGLCKGLSLNAVHNRVRGAMVDMATWLQYEDNRHELMQSVFDMNNPKKDEIQWHNQK